jgi:hypothetical protein
MRNGLASDASINTDARLKIIRLVRCGLNAASGRALQKCHKIASNLPSKMQNTTQHTIASAVVIMLARVER